MLAVFTDKKEICQDIIISILYTMKKRLSDGATHSCGFFVRPKDRLNTLSDQLAHHTHRCSFLKRSFIEIKKTKKLNVLTSMGLHSIHIYHVANNGWQDKLGIDLLKCKVNRHTLWSVGGFFQCR